MSDKSFLINKNEIPQIHPEEPKFILTQNSRYLIDEVGNPINIFQSDEKTDAPKMDSEFRKKVVDLKHKTGCGMIECKKALSATDGDMKRAINILINRSIDNSLI